MRTRHIFFVLFVACAGVVGGCSGGGGSLTAAPPTAAPPTLSPASTPVPLPVDIPYSVQTTYTLATPSPPPVGQTPDPVFLPLPTPAATIASTGGVQVPVNSFPDNTQITMTAQNTLPGALPPVQSSPLQTLSVTPKSSPPPAYTVLFYGSFKFSAKTYTKGACFPIGYPLWYLLTTYPLPSGATYYEAFYDYGSPGWQFGWGVQSESPPGLAANLPPQPVYGPPYTNKLFMTDLQTFCPVMDRVYWWAFYTVPISQATPQPAASPIPNLVALPSAAGFTATGQQVTVVVNDPAYFGTYSASSSNTSIVTVGPSNANGYTFILTAVSGGTANVTITETNGRSVVVPVSVTTTTLGIH